MPIILRDILVDINHADFQFENPLPLVNDANQNIGYAKLEHRSDRIYASLYLNADESFTECFPKANFDSNKKVITSITLSTIPNEDVRIEKVIDQEMFQASAGADNADLK